MLLKSLLLILLCATTAKAEPHPYDLPEHTIIDPIEASERIMSYRTARSFWDNRAPGNFLTRREIGRIGIFAANEAGRRGITNNQEIGLLVSQVIREYQWGSFDAWRTSIGEIVILLPSQFQGSVSQTFLDFIQAIDLGDVAAILAQVVAIIQLFV
jgi:hypothetical protein